MADMSEKSAEDTGNTYYFMVNRKFWNDVNVVLSDFLADHKTDGAYMYSKSANGGRGGYFKVGATFNAYEFAGNTVVFVVDRALTREYPDKGYGVLIDLTEDKDTGKPAVAKYSITGQEFITNYLTGVKYTACAA